MIQFAALYILLMVSLSRAMNDSTRELDAVELAALRQFCPLENVCHVSDDVITTSRRDRLPCCATCNCDCQAEGNCCWGEVANYDFFERPMSRCTVPTSKTIDLSLQHVYNSYFMVDTCPEDSAIAEACGEVPIAPWGSIQPVHSPTKKMSYRNQYCAECHGVADTIPWGTYITCEDSTTKSSLVHVFDALYNNLVWPSNCYASFSHPKSQTETTEKCYVNLVNSCPESYHFIDPIYNLTFEDAENACLSGFISPYRGMAVTFLNPFCALCNNEPSFKYCFVVDVTDARHYSPGITVLLGDFPYASTTFNDKNVNLRQEACYEMNGTFAHDTCRPVLCPSAQTLSPSGSCRHLSTKWVGKLAVYIKLVNPALASSNISSKIPEEIKNLVRWPFREKWSLDSMLIAHFDENDREAIEYLLCIVSYQGKTTHPTRILSDLRNLMETPWNVRLNENRSVSIVPEWLNYSLRHDYNDSLRALVYTHYNASFEHPLRLPMLSPIFMIRNGDVSIGTILNKLLMCEQVELFRTEFILNDPVLFVKKEGKYLLDNLYNVRWLDGDATVRVCVDDTDMRTRDVVLSTSTWILPNLPMTFVLSVVAVVMQITHIFMT